MALFHALYLLFSLICAFVRATDNSLAISVSRDLGDPATVDSLSAIRKRQSGTNPVALGKSLYWFGNFSVGDSGPLNLLVDTGSSDILVNPGLYKPSNQSKPYANKHFTITYEGVNRQGFGFETLNGTVTTDVVSAAGLTVKQQAIGDIKTYKYKDTRPQNRAIQGQGIIGFLGADSSSFSPGAPSWVFSLAKNKAISQARFGLAFGTSGKGLSIIGKLAKNLYKGDLTVATRIVHPFEAWTVKGDVAISGKVLFKNQTLIMDCGTNNIQGPLHIVRQIFKELGYQTVERQGGPNPFNPGHNLTVLSAYFPCNKPPTLGYSIPAQSELASPSSLGTSKTSTIFNVSLAEWDVYDHGNNNCTSILGGINALPDPTIWLLGAPFYSGHYVDHDIAAGKMGFADLKNPSM